MAHIHCYDATDSNGRTWKAEVRARYIYELHNAESKTRAFAKRLQQKDKATASTQRQPSWTRTTRFGWTAYQRPAVALVVDVPQPPRKMLNPNRWD